ncbi:hypothetical protein VTN77DRAFT_60 [Rasamsonia byssochlamydoides]|uniref:uncharacterized protein n=1 Tax=Rasamsonia byssochlamydoides TaxID=89139 RepID=UPI003741F30B
MFARSSRHALGSLRLHLATSRGEALLPTFYSRLDALSLYHSAANKHDDLRFDDGQRPGRRRGRSPRLYRRRLLDRPNHQKMTLDVDCLGKPGEIVVVPLRKRRRQAAQQVQVEQKQSSIEGVPFILGEVETELNAPAETDFSVHIEALRSMYRPGDKLHQEDWMELRRKIEQSFTSDQLEDYISRFQRSSSMSQQGDQQSQAGGRGTWKPGTSFYLDMNPENQEEMARRVARDQDLSGKEFLSERILRDCWQLGVVGEVGQLDIQLPSHAISLLLRSNRYSFEELAHSHQAKIDVTHSLNLVRITGSQSACESIRDIIEDFLSHIREDPLDLSLLNSLRDGNGDPASSEFLEWVEKSYGVACKREGRRSQGTIYYSADNKAMADRARRDLDLANKTRAAAAPIPFCTYVPASQQANVYAVNTEGATSWFDRKKQWFRWFMPSAQSETSDGMSAPLFDQHDSCLSSDILGLLRGMSNANTDPIQDDVEESLTALVGKCLFLHQPAMNETTISASRLGELSLPRIFTGNIPKISPFLRLLTPFPGSDHKQIHRIRLTPSSTNIHPMPPLELELGVMAADGWAPSPSDLVVRKVKAIVKENSLDFLLPENGLDIRFTRTVYRDLLGTSRRIPESDVSTPDDDVSIAAEIMKCLEQVVVNYRVYGDSALPAFCHLQLPRRVVETSLSSDGEHADSSHGEEGSIRAEYLFPPVKSFKGTRIFLYDFLGERLSYGYPEGGPLFPQQTTHLSLDMDVIKGSRPSAVDANNTSSLSEEEMLQKEFHSFYRTACKMAFELGKVPGKV